MSHYDWLPFADGLAISVVTFWLQDRYLSRAERNFPSLAESMPDLARGGDIVQYAGSFATVLPLVIALTRGEIEEISITVMVFITVALAGILAFTDGDDYAFARRRLHMSPLFFLTFVLCLIGLSTSLILDWIRAK